MSDPKLETYGDEAVEQSSFLPNDSNAMYPGVSNIDPSVLVGLSPEEIYMLVHQIPGSAKTTPSVDGLSEIIPGKNPFKSKVVWANVVLFCSAVLAIIIDSHLFTEYREVLLIIVAVLNVYMRFGTMTPLEPLTSFINKDKR